MDGGLSCALCKEVYDFDIHRPKALPCGHTFCLECLDKLYDIHGRLPCSLCAKIIWVKAETLPDNQAIKDLLEPLQVRCCKHPSEIAKQFCLVHMMEICAQCQHQSSTCKIKDITEDRVEIATSVHSRIEKLTREAGPLSQELRHQLDRRYLAVLTNVVKLMHDIEQTLALKCAECGRDVAFFPLSGTHWAFCSQHLTPGSEFELEPIGQLCQIEVSQALMLKLAAFLKTVNFCDVPKEVLDALKASSKPEPKKILDLYQDLQTFRPRIDYEGLPEMLICPGCLVPISKASGFLRVLPCMPQLHALCEQCLQLMLDLPICCPLDGNEFHVSLNGLKRLEPSQPCQPLQPPSFVPSNNLPMPIFHWTPPKKPEPRPPPVQGGHPRCTPLPTVSVPSGYSYLDRFISVLPEFGTSLYLHFGNNKGWVLNQDRNQVEAFNFYVSDEVFLAGLALSTPIVSGVSVYVESLTIMQGSIVLFINPGRQELLGGNSICQDIYFQSPFRVIPCTPYTLKIKLKVARVVSDAPVMLYRGCPYDRPPVWSGSDFTVWDFQETKELEAGEYSSGQGNLSGPVLRLYYYK